MYSEAEVSARGAPAVLLCYPGVHEYNTSHWAYRRLASGLSQSGLSSLRFDYFGTGDSLGETGAPSVESMVEDIVVAGRELLDLSGARRLWLVGLRLGATAACLATTRDLPLRGVALWDCVANGDEYVRELEERDSTRNMLFLHWNDHKRAVRSGELKELLGFPMAPEERLGLRRFDLATALRCADEDDGVDGESSDASQTRTTLRRPPEHVALIDGSVQALEQVQTYFQKWGSAVSSTRTGAVQRDERSATGNEVLLSGETIEMIVRTIAGEA